MKGFAAHTSTCSGLKDSSGSRLSSISCLVAQTRVYCFVANLMACGRLHSVTMTTRMAAERRERRRAQSLLSIMMTANEGIGCPGVLSGIISLDCNEKDEGTWTTEWKTAALSHCPCESRRLIIVKSENSLRCFWVNYSRAAHGNTFHHNISNVKKGHYSWFGNITAASIKRFPFVLKLNY